MTLFFRLILIAVSVLNFFYMARKLRKSHVEGVTPSSGCCFPSF